MASSFPRGLVALEETVQVVEFGVEHLRPVPEAIHPDAHIFVVHALVRLLQRPHAFLPGICQGHLTVEVEERIVEGHDDVLKRLHPGYVHLRQFDVIVLGSAGDGQVECPFVHIGWCQCPFDVRVAKQERMDVVQVCLHVLALIGIQVGPQEEGELYDDDDAQDDQ